VAPVSQASTLPRKDVSLQSSLGLSRQKNIFKSVSLIILLTWLCLVSMVGCTFGVKIEKSLVQHDHHQDNTRKQDRLKTPPKHTNNDLDDEAPRPT
jgi:hypothetical protein